MAFGKIMEGDEGTNFGKYQVPPPRISGPEYGDSLAPDGGKSIWDGVLAAVLQEVVRGGTNIAADAIRGQPDAPAPYPKQPAQVAAPQVPVAPSFDSGMNSGFSPLTIERTLNKFGGK